MLRYHLLLTIPFAGLAAFWPHSAAAQQTWPSGNYIETCYKPEYVDGNPKYMKANCYAKSKEVAAAQSRLYLFGCAPGSIYNDNGQLRCAYDRGRAENEVGLSAFQSAGALILGRVPTYDEAVRFASFGLTRKIRYDDLMAAELDFGGAAEVLKAWLAVQSEAEAAKVVRAAYQQVYGPSTADTWDRAYLAKIKAGQAWYTTIVLDQKKLKASKP